MSENIDNLKESEKGQSEYLEVEASNSEDSSSQKSGAIIGGVVLILIGGIFLFSNLTGGFPFNNWWALFILIPAVASLGNAYREYQAAGQLNSKARGSLIGGLIMTFVAAVFIFDWDWGAIWPVFLIIGGIGALLAAFWD